VIEAPHLVWQPVFPELILAGAAIVGLLYEALAPHSDRRVHLAIGLAGLAGAAAASADLWHWDREAAVMGNMVAVDRYAVLGRLLLLAIGAMGLLYGTFDFRRAGSTYRGEFYPLVLFATAGMTMIVAAADLILVFLALEILSLALYVLTGLTGRRGATEAAMKYFLLGATSSAIFLYGVAMAYGATGTTRIGVMANALVGQTGSRAIALLGLAFLAVGFGFKISAAPFHMWTPDVYQGAPTPVTAYMSAATKVAAFLALIRVLDVAFQALAWDWTPIVWALAAVSVIVGSVLAIAQTDAKRMLAYSSIAHAGFILTGLTSANAAGIRAALFYLVAYAAMTLGAFGVVMLVSGTEDARAPLAAYAGLGRRSPFLAGLLTLFLLSLAGVPPTAGFIAKVNVFSAAIQAGHWPLAAIGVAMSVAAAFFYLRVIVLMYMQEAGAEADERSALMRIALAVPAVGVLVLGVFPGLLLPIVERAAVLRW
jgi:NADH-quinone oxidoreductase subunit N